MTKTVEEILGSGVTAERCGLVHGDLHSGNIISDKSGTLRLLDVGSIMINYRLQDLLNLMYEIHQEPGAVLAKETALLRGYEAWAKLAAVGAETVQALILDADLSELEVMGRRMETQTSRYEEIRRSLTMHSPSFVPATLHRIVAGST